MKALYFTKHGDLSVIQYGEVPRPRPGFEEVLIRVAACAINRLDIWVRRGWPGLNLEMPHWCGADVAGEIAELGEGVSGWQKGQRVVVDPGITTLEDEFVRRGEISVSPGYRILGEHTRGGGWRICSCSSEKSACYAGFSGICDRCRAATGQPYCLAYAYAPCKASSR
ncbi:MAG TPA: hypothetical protein ENI07_10605 [Desulfobacterales bacterium]|nr:hypothetical protein [Desulfobacterales bacterium]